MTTAQPKAPAALSSTLLARKGMARPAMRPQGFGGHAPSLDDLGWNDMGSSEPVGDVLSDVLPDAAPESVPIPSVLRERAALKVEIEVPRASVSIATATRIRRDSAKQTKGMTAAFTLRLDADRHLRLRLASAIEHLSAQQLVTKALDAFLQTLPDVEALIARLPDQGNGR